MFSLIFNWLKVKKKPFAKKSAKGFYYNLINDYFVVSGFTISSNSTSKISAEFGPISAPAPRSP